MVKSYDIKLLFGFNRIIVILIVASLLIAFEVLTSTALAVTWHVSIAGSETNGGTSWEDSFATIQKGIDEASDGDTVLVADGIYTGEGNKNIIVSLKNIEVRSLNGPDNCLIDIENEGKGFRLEFTPATSVIDGFTIMNGHPDSDLSYGVGIMCSFCSTTIRNCIIKNNSGVQWGAGIRISGALTTPPVIVNTVFVGNTTSIGASAVSAYQTPATFLNCTFTGNTSFQSVIVGPNNVSIANSIVWNNNPGDIGGPNPGVDPIITYSDIEGGYPGDGNIDADPLFLNSPNLWDRTTAAGTATNIEVSNAALYSIGDVLEIDNDGVVRTVTASSGQSVAFTPALGSASTAGLLIENWGTGATELVEDFHLYTGSQCIDGGYNLVTGIAERDLDGKPRFIDGDNDMDATVDMGTYEYGDIGECDFNEDLDVDGADLVEFINDSHGFTLTAFVEDFGRADCTYYIK